MLPHQCRLPTMFSFTRLRDSVRYPKQKISLSKVFSFGYRTTGGILYKRRGDQIFQIEIKTKMPKSKFLIKARYSKE